MNNQGKLVTITKYHALCGGCGFSDEKLASTHRKEARTNAIRAGWGFTVRGGFQCPTCYGAHRGTVKLERTRNRKYPLKSQ
jgi:hypothetical protein